MTYLYIANVTNANAGRSVLIHCIKFKNLMYDFEGEHVDQNSFCQQLTMGLKVDSFQVLFLCECRCVWLTPAQITNNRRQKEFRNKSWNSWFLELVKWHEQVLSYWCAVLISKKSNATGPSINLACDNAAETTFNPSFLARFSGLNSFYYHIFTNNYHHLL